MAGPHGAHGGGASGPPRAPGGPAAGPRDDGDRTARLVLAAATASLDALSVLEVERDPSGTAVDFRFAFTNAAAARVIGRSVADIVGHSATELFGADAAQLVARWDGVARRGEPLLEEIPLGDGPEPRWIRQQVVPLPGGVAVTSHDITDRRRAEDELERRALHDPLTDLPNRVLAERRLAEALELGAGGPLLTAVAFVDLDHFKRINDAHGHALGDELLCRVAERLRSGLRTGDTVARFGGDEFVICLPGVRSTGEAARVVDGVADRLRAPIDLGGVGTGAALHLLVTASIGVAAGRLGEGDLAGLGTAEAAATLVHDADLAAYRAKGRGRDGVVVADAHERPCGR